MIKRIDRKSAIQYWKVPLPIQSMQTLSSRYLPTDSYSTFRVSSYRFKQNHRDLFVRFIANLGLRIRLTTHRCPQQSPHVVSCLDYFSVDLCCSNPVIICQVPIRLRGRRRRSRLDPGWPKSWKPRRRRKLRLRQLWWWRRRWWWHQGPASTNPIRSHGTVPEKTCRNHQIIERIKAGLFFIPADIASKQLQLLQQPVN